MTSPTEEKPSIEEKLAYALQLYREGKITEHEFGEMLGLETRLEIDEVLKANNCFIDYSGNEVAAQRQAIRQAALWRNWTASHSRNSPLLSDEAISRESIYRREDE